jgi:hypothetical protein
MSYRELRRSDLLDALFALEREEDINRWGGLLCLTVCQELGRRLSGAMV